MIDASVAAAPLRDHVHVAIAGSGFAGLGMAIRLQEAGIDDFVVLERAHDVGGVWRDNTYPGCACDVQSHLYSFSFAPNPAWSHSYSRQPEIQAYLQGCAKRYGLLPHIRFGHEVREAAWDDDERRWRIETSRGVVTADVFVAATGALSEPAMPQLEGLERFAGKVMHSARWERGHDLTGERVAVVGTGASAVQIVPAIQPEVQELIVFQRTASWVLPRGDRALSGLERRLFATVPALQHLARASVFGLRELLVLGFMHPRLMALNERLARRHLERSVPDPALRAKLTPAYTIGCKRILLSDDYLATFTKENVTLVTQGIREVRERSIVSDDGAEHDVDTLVLATGFRVTDPPIAGCVRGRDGRTLADVWQGSPRAHLGTTVAGFPSFFLLQGPNTGLGHTSVILMIESQIEHVLEALRYARARGLVALEPRAEAQEAFVAEVDARMRGTVWTSGGCASWYLDRTGRNSTLWPGSTRAFHRRVARFNPKEYVAHG